jgi:hypothetical protein
MKGWAIERAAIDAEQEAEGLREAAMKAMALEGESDVLYDAATDAINAYGRSRERAKSAQIQADHYWGGAYNAWDASDHPQR